MSKRIKNATPGGPLPRQDNRRWINLQVTVSERTLADDVCADVLENMRHLPSTQLTFGLCWQRFLEEMSRVAPNWEIFKDLPYQ